MKTNYCSNCGTPLQPGMKFCPRCGYALNKENCDVSTLERHVDTNKLNNSNSNIFFSFATIANIITMFCLMIIVYDSYEQCWFHRAYGNQLFYNRELMNSIRVSVFSSPAVALFILLSGIKKFSIFGNVLMASGALITTCAIVFIVNNYNLIDWPALFTYVIVGWVVISVLYFWTTLFTSCLEKKNLAFIICLGISVLYGFLLCYSFKYA